MLIRFTVENFLSFNQRIDFNMIASDDSENLNHVVREDAEESIKLLRSSIIYGANASGKSNLIKAMKFAQEFIVDGIDKNKNININNFRLDTSCYSKPSRFEFEFKSQNRQYAYGFLVDKHQIHEEWLFEIGLNIEKRIYERNEQKIEINWQHEIFKDISDEYEINRIKYEAGSTRENLLFLTNCQEREIKYLDDVYKWFRNILTIIFPNSRPFIIDYDLNVWNPILESFDLGIKGINIKETDLDDYQEIPTALKKEIKENFPYEDTKTKAFFIPQFGCVITQARDKLDKLSVKHLSTVRIDNNNDEVKFKISEESEGTQRLIDLVPMLIKLAQGDTVVVIDEIERSLHVLLIRQLFDLFLNSPNNRNLNSQLIASTHEVCLLDIKNIFRKDEIWFVEKDKYGQSIFYSLANTNVEDLDLVSGYLSGRFGAIPFIQNLQELGWSK